MRKENGGRTANYVLLIEFFMRMASRRIGISFGAIIQIISLKPVFLNSLSGMPKSVGQNNETHADWTDNMLYCLTRILICSTTPEKKVLQKYVCVAQNSAKPYIFLCTKSYAFLLDVMTIDHQQCYLHNRCYGHWRTITNRNIRYFSVSKLFPIQVVTK